MARFRVPAKRVRHLIPVLDCRQRPAQSPALDTSLKWSTMVCTAPIVPKKENISVWQESRMALKKPTPVCSPAFVPDSMQRRTKMRQAADIWEMVLLHIRD